MEVLEFKRERSSEGWILTIGDTKWVYAWLKKPLAKVEALALALDMEAKE